MHLGVVGINHKSADLASREAVAQACKQAFPCKYSVLLSTCNRTEVYFSHDDLDYFHKLILQLFKSASPSLMEPAIYSYMGNACFFHLAQVTAGLDSAIVAESDIQRQVKQAYSLASSYSVLPNELHYLFQKCLNIGKKVRSEGKLFHKGDSLEQIVLDLTRCVFCSTSPSILFIGNSQINRKIISLFSKRGLSNIALATRTVRAAEPFAYDQNVVLGDISLIQKWHTFEMVISGTNHEEYLIQSIPENPTTKLILDLSVPRSVDPALSQHPLLSLLNMEQISNLAVSRRDIQQQEVQQTKKNILATVDKHVVSYREKRGYKTICAHI
jgi:glutamyl-tRNA reductase